MISPLAYIHPEAKIGENVEIGPFVYIDKNVVIGDNNTVMPNANILYGSRIVVKKPQPKLVITISFVRM